MYQSSTNPYPPHIPIISIPHPLGHPILPALPPKHIDRPPWTTLHFPILAHHPQLDLLHIPEIPFLKQAQPPLHPHNLRPSHRGQKQALPDPDIKPSVALVQKPHVSRHQTRLSHRFENTGTVPAAHVGAETNIDAGVEKGADGAEPAAQRGVGGGTVCDFGGPVFYQRYFGRGQVYGVREDCARGQQGGGVVDGGVRGTVREERAHEGAFGFVLGDVGLDAEGVRCGERAEGG